jgi:circadian clock protein KaiC
VQPVDATTRHSTGIPALDDLIGGGIPKGTRAILLGPHGSGKTVFSMQFLWAGLQAGETVSYDVFDRPWTKMRAYFASFGWDVARYEAPKKFLAIQAFPHFDAFERDPHVRYFSLSDFEKMQRIDLELTDAGVTRFVFGDSYEHIFQEGTEEEWHRVEQWTVNWTHASGITNFDLVNEVASREPHIQRLMDFTLLLADHIIRFRTREVEGRFRRELRLVRMEGVSHPLGWIPFEIRGDGIHLLSEGHAA